MLYRLGHLCVRHRYTVAAAGLVLAVAIAIVAKTVGEQTSNNLTLPGTESTEATDLLDQYLPHEANGTNPVALQAPRGKLTDSTNSKVVRATVQSLEKTSGVRSAVSPLSSDGSDALSKDETIGYISLTLVASPSRLSEDEANEIVAATSPATDAGFEVGAGGYLGQDVSKPSTRSSEAVGLTAAVIILLFAFGTVVAMGLPITTALLGLVTGLSLVGILGHLIEVPSVAETLGTMIGLGVGIDYALFIVTRHRAQVNEGVEVYESIARSMATSGAAVAFAGSTVIVALVSLAFAGIPIVSALGVSAAFVVLVAVLAALTLLPALLAILGTRIESLPVHFGRKRPHDDKPHGWLRWARWIAARPWLAVAISVLILGVLTAPILDLRLGQEDNGQLPESTTLRRSYDLISDGFGSGTNGPFLIAMAFDPEATNDQKSFDKLKQQQQTAQQQQEQAVEQGGGGGPQPAAGDPAGRGRRPAERQAAAARSAEAVPEVDGERPRPGQAPEQDQAHPGGQVGLTGEGRHDGQRGGIHRDPDDRALVRGDPGPRPAAARHRDSRRAEGHQGRRLRRRHHGRLHRPRRRDRRQAPVGDPGRRRAQLHPADAGLPLAARAAQGRDHEPALDRRRLRRRHGSLREGLGPEPDRARPHRAGRQLRAAADVRDPVRPLDGLRGVPDDPDQGALRQDQGQLPIGDRRPRTHRPHHHLGGADHGLRLFQLHPQRRPRREAVRRRARGGDRRRRDDRALHARPGRDGPAAKRQLVPAGVARPHPAHIGIESEEFETPEPKRARS